MRQAVRSKPRGAVKSRSLSLPAPVGGLNARDSVANMRPTDALQLDNWFPQPTSVEVRRGYTQHATFTGICQSILVYSGLSSTKVFVAVNTTNDAIIDATSGGAISTPVVGGSGPTVQAITNCRFDYVNFGTTGGQFMDCVNGTDTAISYDGTTWTTISLTHASLASTDDLFTVAVYAERKWYAEKNTFNVYYLPVATQTGAMTRLNLGSLFKLGGSLNSIITLTDATDQLEDYIAFVSTEGEIVAFAGTDPSSPSTWRRAAQFRVGRPVIKGNRAWTKWGADALLLCADGLLPLRRAISQNSRDTTLTVSDKIRNLLNTDVQVHGGRQGWDITLHPTGFKLILNVPLAEDSSSRQYVMNVQTGAWCRFTGWDAFCFAVARDQLYFGGNGFLAAADTVNVYADNGSAITASAKQAFNYFGGRGRNVLVNLMRPILSLDGSVNIALDIDVDFEDHEPTIFTQTGGSTGDPWGGIWDVSWGGAQVVERSWRSVNGFGSAIAPRIKVQAEDVNMSWAATDFLFEPGAQF